jgi:Na+-translocating ferredoxin:NAD+ oxidoreductase subunit B
MDWAPYQRLAARLDALPNGFPPTEDGIELRLLAKLYTPEQAALTAELRLTQETPAQVAARIGGDVETVATRLAELAAGQLIAQGREGDEMVYGLLPFVVGVYENRVPYMDEEAARLFDEYYHATFARTVAIEPQYHRVIPVHESVPFHVEIHPYESVAAIVDSAKAWGVVPCVCRLQKALVGEPCDHPVEVCMPISQTPDAFEGSARVRALTRDEALATLRRAADAGLVHTVRNYRAGLWYICNCCTCACGILRAVTEAGLPAAAARSPFASQVDESRCTGCETCLSYCQFGALALDDGGTAQVDEMRCVGCGLCVVHCPEEALSMARRPADAIRPVPVTEDDWLVERAAARGLNLDDVL